MINRSTYLQKQKQAVELLEKSGIYITDREKNEIEAVDFGLNHIDVEGAQILTMFSTERVSGKILALLPGQIEPEHWHPPVGQDMGKEETLRIAFGTLQLYVPGENNAKLCRIPQGKEACYTVMHEVVLGPGEQYTLQPGTKHWFQAGGTGAVAYTISTCARDILDRFTDPNVVRKVEIAD